MQSNKRARIEHKKEVASLDPPSEKKCDKYLFGALSINQFIINDVYLTIIGEDHTYTPYPSKKHGMSVPDFLINDVLKNSNNTLIGLECDVNFTCNTCPPHRSYNMNTIVEEGKRNNLTNRIVCTDIRQSLIDMKSLYYDQTYRPSHKLKTSFINPFDKIKEQLYKLNSHLHSEENIRTILWYKTKVDYFYEQSINDLKYEKNTTSKLTTLRKLWNSISEFYILKTILSKAFKNKAFFILMGNSHAIEFSTAFHDFSYNFIKTDDTVCVDNIKLNNVVY